MRERGLQIGVLVGALLASQCRGEPAPSVAPTASPSAPAALVSAPSALASVAPVPVAPVPVAPVPVAPVASVAPAADARSQAEPAPAAPDEPEDLPLLGADGAPLPQTEARPKLDERFARRMQRLADSILTGDVEPARASFFPLVAYAQVKDVKKPERDYRYRLMAHFERDLREYRKALGKEAERVQFLGVTVPEARVEWMKPGREGNRLGYFRVLRSSLRFRLPSGREQTLELTSMISWRGEWYVVHLHGFE